MLRGSHFSGCFINCPECLCLQCAKDSTSDADGKHCCEKYSRFCDDEPCKGFVPEETEGEIDV